MAQKVEVEVVDIQAGGVLVTILPDGRTGFIRRRELSWERRLSFREEIPQRGQRFKALIVQETLWLENVTFALNEAQSGTAVSNGGSGVITMTNVTIARNVRTLTNPPDASAVSNYGGSITAVNTLIADNGPNQQCGGAVPLTSLGHNLDGHNGCNFNQPTDLTFSDPQLDTFAQVTGTPNFVSPLTFFASSPALDAGNAAYCPATDARGTTRPKGTGCDIGAYEFDNYQVFLPSIVSSP